MVHRLKSLISGLAIASLSGLVCLLVLEFAVFRTVLVPDDVLENVTIDGVVRYRPGSVAVFRHPDGRRSTVAVNAQGWNSARHTYDTPKSKDRLRVAVVGDSYVHAAFVDPSESFAARLEAGLTSSDVAAEVFRFGMDGAPLSQYLYMLRREVVAYKPDVVVVPIIHNDFDEMYRGVRTRYASSFMKLRKTECGGVAEIAPVEFKPGLAAKLRQSAMFRYLYYETNLYLYAKRWISRFYWGGEEDWDPRFISAAVDIRKISDHESNRFFARYVLEQMKALSAEHGFRLVFIMDAVREAIYEKHPPMKYEIGRLNRIAREETARLGLMFIDLQDAFAADYKANGKRFEYAYDWHWNARGNQIVADVLTPLVAGLAGKTQTRATPTQRAASASLTSEMDQKLANCG
ncbi:MAG: SGNH/GDSL hydrolase family protein [Pseudomonadota bacterium]